MTDPTPNPGKKIISTGDWTKGVPRQRPPQPTPAPRPKGPSQGFLEKMKSITESYASRGFSQDKRCDEQTKRVRSVSCHGDSELGIPPCPFRRESKVEEGRFYCGECGCGDRQATWLNAKTPQDYTKLDFPKVVCPLNMPGFSNYTKSTEESPERKAQYDFSRKEQIEKSVDLTIKQTDEKN